MFLSIFEGCDGVSSGVLGVGGSGFHWLALDESTLAGSNVTCVSVMELVGVPRADRGVFEFKAGAIGISRLRRRRLVSLDVSGLFSSSRLGRCGDIPRSDDVVEGILIVWEYLVVFWSCEK